MTPTLFHSKMFDVGDLPVLTFGNCVLKNGVIKWPLKLYVSFLTCFFQNPKTRLFYVFWVVDHVFSAHVIWNAGVVAGVQHATSDAPRGYGLPRHWRHRHPADSHNSDPWHRQEMHHWQEVYAAFVHTIADVCRITCRLVIIYCCTALNVWATEGLEAFSWQTKDNMAIGCGQSNQTSSLKDLFDRIDNQIFILILSKKLNFMLLYNFCYHSFILAL